MAEEKIINLEQKRKEREGTERTSSIPLLEFLIKHGEYQRLSETDEFWALSEEGQVHVTQEALSNRIRQQEARFSRLVSKNPQAAGTYLDKKIKPLRILSEALDQYATSFSVVKEDPSETA